jgi:protein CpxP
MSDELDTAKSGKCRKGGRKLCALAIGITVAVGVVFGIQAFSDSKAYGHMQQLAGYYGGGHGGHHKSFSDLSDEELRTRIERMVKHAAIEIDATQEQQEKIAALVTAAAKDLKPMHERLRATGKEIHNLLLADTVDRTALEKLRAERLADAELISKNLVSALADVAEVLSPEQRKALDERIKEFRFMGRGWHRG